LVVPRNEKENLILELVTSLLLTSTTGGDETDLLARNVVATGSGWVTNVLMVTTSVRVLDRVHGTTTDLRPRVPLDAVLVVGTTSLKERLVETTATGDDTDGGTTGVLDPLLGAGWETELGAGTVDILGDEGAVVAGGAGDDATVTRADLKVGDDGTLREGGHWESVASNELGCKKEKKRVRDWLTDGKSEASAESTAHGTMSADFVPTPASKSYTTSLNPLTWAFRVSMPLRWVEKDHRRANNGLFSSKQPHPQQSPLHRGGRPVHPPQVLPLWPGFDPLHSLCVSPLNSINHIPVRCTRVV